MEHVLPLCRDVAHQAGGVERTIDGTNHRKAVRGELDVGPVLASFRGTADSHDDVALAEHVGVVARGVEPLFERGLRIGVPGRDVLAKSGRLAGLDST